MSAFWWATVRFAGGQVSGGQMSSYRASHTDPYYVNYILPVYMYVYNFRNINVQLQYLVLSSFFAGGQVSGRQMSSYHIGHKIQICMKQAKQLN